MRKSSNIFEPITDLNFQIEEAHILPSNLIFGQGRLKQPKQRSRILFFLFFWRKSHYLGKCQETKNNLHKIFYKISPYKIFDKSQWKRRNVRSLTWIQLYCDLILWRRRVLTPELKKRRRPVPVIGTVKIEPELLPSLFDDNIEVDLANILTITQLVVQRFNKMRLLPSLFDDNIEVDLANIFTITKLVVQRFNKM